MKRVAVMQDGAVDELISVLLLTTMPDVEIAYVDIVNADCLGYPAYQATQKLRWGIGYRVLDVDFDDGSGANRFKLDTRQAGLVTGVVIGF